MHALTRLTDFHASLLAHIGDTFPVEQPTLKQWLGEVGELGHSLERIQPALQQIVDATDALALTAQLLDADHTGPINADRIRCLLEPLRDRLEVAMGQIREVI